jgi:hypothetical protein
VFRNGVSVEKELCSHEAMTQEIRGKGGNPIADGKADPSLEYEQRDTLLQDESNNNGRPTDNKDIRMRFYMK